MDPCPEGNFSGPLRQEHGCSHQACANKLCEGDRAAKAAQMVVVTSQAAAEAFASGIATSDSDTTIVRSTAAALALMEATHEHVEAAHVQLMAVTAQIERSFSDNGRQPMAEELAITESVRGAVRSSAAYLA